MEETRARNPPDLAALRAREAELVAQRARLESSSWSGEDIVESARLLDEINELNARIGVVRDAVKEFPGAANDI